MTNVKKVETINIAVPKKTHAVLLAEKKKTKAPLYKIAGDLILDGLKLRRITK